MDIKLIPDVIILLLRRKINLVVKLVSAFALANSLYGCSHPNNRTLPILGHTVVENNDTIYSKIADFSFVDQDSNLVTNATFGGKIYVADFIFLSCPTVCPKLTSVIHTAYKKFEKEGRVMFLSHTIDPEKDSVTRLKEHTQNLGISGAKWHFVTGKKEAILQLANSSYFSIAYPDSTAEGGFTHSGAILLVDTKRRVRGVYNGMEQNETKRLLSDIAILLEEKN